MRKFYPLPLNLRKKKRTEKRGKKLPEKLSSVPLAGGMKKSTSRSPHPLDSSLTLLTTQANDEPSTQVTRSEPAAYRSGMQSIHSSHLASRSNLVLLHRCLRLKNTRGGSFEEEGGIEDNSRPPWRLIQELPSPSSSFLYISIRSTSFLSLLIVNVDWRRGG